MEGVLGNQLVQSAEEGADFLLFGFIFRKTEGRLFYSRFRDREDFGALHYGELRTAVEQHRPDVVCLVGDFLDAEDLPPSNERLTPTGAALALAALPCEIVLARGNHEDYENWPEFEAAWQTTGRTLNAPHRSAVKFGQLVIVGFPCGLGDDSAWSAGREPTSHDPEEWMSDLLRTTGPAGLHLPLDQLCGGTIVCGMTGSGKTVSVVNPLTLQLAALEATTTPPRLKPAAGGRKSVTPWPSTPGNGWSRGKRPPGRSSIARRSSSFRTAARGWSFLSNATVRRPPFNPLPRIPL